MHHSDYDYQIPDNHALQMSPNGVFPRALALCLVVLYRAGAQTTQTSSASQTQTRTQSQTQTQTQTTSTAPGQCIVTVAGPLKVEGAPATAMQLWGPQGVAPDGTGGFYASDTLSNTVRHVFSPNWTMVTSAGQFRAPNGERETLQ